MRPTLEALEAREVPSANPLDGLLGAVAPGVVPISFNSVTNQAGQLVANGQVGVNPISVPLTLTASPGSNNATDILQLHLAPIHLNVLGLHVDTSNICLDITAHQGGGLLGNLLYSVAHALDTNGNNLGNALSGLNPIQNLLFNLELTTLLNGGLNAATSPSALQSTATPNPDPNACNILNLSLGPVSLNLLGLEVDLNNCATPQPGPVTVDVTGTHDGLLGNLLCGLTNVLNPSGNVNLPFDSLVGNIFNVI